ncbi:MAG: S-layer homology domain-containing protein [Coprothermobacterota bacterium]|nr:S-layer homology domain-containing protein [Coprothermobacterota bacterium]
MYKKLLAIVITAAMLLTLIPLAAFAEDTTTPTTTTEPAATTPVVVPFSDIFGTPYESAFIKLHLMGIFTGYPDKTFKPDKSVTRSEFLAVTIRALNFDKYVSGFKGATKYPDTAVDHWAAGYINMGTAFGIIKGYPDGTFRPDANVSYAEASTMLVRMLGYTQYLTPVTPGGGTEDWFANFVRMAVALGDPVSQGFSAKPPFLDLPDGLLTGTQAFNAANPASRGDLAIMAYNAMWVYPVGQFLWQTEGPVPGGLYDIDWGSKTLAQALGYFEMETIVTNAPTYDVYASSAQVELLEGWTTLKAVDGLAAGTFIPYGQGWTNPVDGKFYGWTDPQEIAALFGLSYPADFKPVHRLYNIHPDSMWVGGRPADLTTLIGKPIRVIYSGNTPYVGMSPDTQISTLHYVRVLPHEIVNYKIAANSVGGKWFPGKTVGEIYSTGTLRVYHPTTEVKAPTTISIDSGRAVIFLQDTNIWNPDVMLIKDADISIVRGLATRGTYLDYEGHLFGYQETLNPVYALLAKVWPGHIIKNCLPKDTWTNSYDEWGRVKQFYVSTFQFTDDNTWNKRLPTPYPTEPGYVFSVVEDEAKIMLGGAPYTMWTWYDAGRTGYDAFNWFMTANYSPGTGYFAPIKKLPSALNVSNGTHIPADGSGPGLFSLVRWEGAENVATGLTLEDIYRTKDQWGNDWVTQIKAGGKIYDVLFPGRGEFATIAASITGSTAEPTAPVGQVGSVESGATFSSNEFGSDLVFNNLWDERLAWIGSKVDLFFSYPNDAAKPLVRWMASSSGSTSPGGPVDYGVVTNVNMVSNVDGYMVSIQIMDQFGNIKTIYFPKIGVGPLSVNFLYWKDDGAAETITVNLPFYDQWIFGGASYYAEHNKGAWGQTNYATDATDYNAVYAFWTKLNENLLRDLVQVSYSTDNVLGVSVPFVTELYCLEGIVKQAGPTFDGTVFSLKDVMGVKPTVDAFIPTGYWGSWDYFKLALRPAAPPLPVGANGYTALQWMAKDMVTIPWDTGSNAVNSPKVIAGTGIWDTSLPAPNVPTPDGNILIKKMADLQREQWVQIFFRPIYDLDGFEQSANPYMLEWQLINGEFVPVVKYIIIRPRLGGAIKNVDERPVPDSVAKGYPVLTGTVWDQPGVWKQFNQTLDMSRSTISLFNISAGAWYTMGKTLFMDKTFPKDTIVFQPGFTDLLGNWVRMSLDPGKYLVLVTGYDAYTNGTQSLVYTWNFTIDDTPPVVTITAPTAGQIFTTATVPAAWTATDPDDLLADLVFAYKVDAGSYSAWAFVTSATLTGLLSGNHTLTVKAKDPAGNTSAEVSVTFQVNLHVVTTITLTPITQPTVIFWSPNTGISLPLTVLVKNELGDPMAGIVVNLSTTFGTLSVGSVTTGALGTATFTVSSTADGTASITASSAGVTSNIATVVFLKVPAPPDF